MSGPQNLTQYVDITILSGAATNATALSTGLVGPGQWQLVGFEFPEMTSASATITGSRTESGTYVTIYEVGGASTHTLTLGASARFVPVDPRVTLSFPFYKIVTSGNEGADRTITAHLRRIQ